MTLNLDDLERVVNLSGAHVKDHLVWPRAEIAALIARLREAEANCHRACAAIGWDAAVAAMRYEDGTPVEIISMTNPYRP